MRSMSKMHLKARNKETDKEFQCCPLLLLDQGSNLLHLASGGSPLLLDQTGTKDPLPSQEGGLHQAHLLPFQGVDLLDL